MKSIIFSLLFLSATAQAGIDPKSISFSQVKCHEAIIYQAEPSMSVEQAFSEVDKIAFWYMNRVVIKDGVKYFRYGFTPLKKNTYILTERKHRSVIKKVNL